MLSQKLTRITLKMTDFEEFDRVKREHERAMDTSQRPVPSSCSSCSRTEGWHANIINIQTGSVPTERIGRGGGGRNPVRASTPDTPQN